MNAQAVSKRFLRRESGEDMRLKMSLKMALKKSATFNVTVPKTMDNYTIVYGRQPNSFVGELTCRVAPGILREL